MHVECTYVCTLHMYITIDLDYMVVVITNPWSLSCSSALRTTSLEEEESDFFVPSTEVVATVAQVSRQKENVVSYCH